MNISEKLFLIVKRVKEVAEKYSCKMSQIAIAWQWAKGVVSPIIGATKPHYLEDAVGAIEGNILKTNH